MEGYRKENKNGPWHVHQYRSRSSASKRERIDKASISCLRVACCLWLHLPSAIWRLAGRFDPVAFELKLPRLPGVIRIGIRVFASHLQCHAQILFLRQRGAFASACPIATGGQSRFSWLEVPSNTQQIHSANFGRFIGQACRQSLRAQIGAWRPCSSLWPDPGLFVDSIPQAI